MLVVKSVIRSQGKKINGLKEKGPRGIEKIELGILSPIYKVGINIYNHLQ